MSGAWHAASVAAPVARTWSYTAYGLTLLSNIPLPELTHTPQIHANEASTLRFSLRHERFTAPSREVMSWNLPTGEPWLSCAKFEGGYVLRFVNLADFCVDRMGQEIICHPISALAPETLCHLLLDQVFPLALNVRGQDALHATSVLTPYGVCAFTGATGMGKSTLAANFHRADYPILSDDCLVLKNHRGNLSATPAYPGLRLWDDTLSALDFTCSPTRPVAHYTTKQRLLTPDRIDHLPETSRALVAIYSLIRQPIEDAQPFPSVQSERLTRRAALMELLPHVFRMDVTTVTCSFASSTF